MRRINLLFFVILLIPLMGSGQGFYTLSGIITDSVSGKALKDIDIVVENKLTGTISNTNGSYILYLPKGDYKVKFSANSFEKQTVEINLTNNLAQMVELSPKIKILKNKNQGINRFAFLKKKQQNELLSDNLN